MRRIYLLLAVVGTVLPYLFFGQYIFGDGASIVGFVSAVIANPPATGFTADLLMSSLVFWIMMFYNRRQGKGPKPLLFVVLNLVVGLSCALPVYLYAQSRE
jgi:hypothetical protein